MVSVPCALIRERGKKFLGLNGDIVIESEPPINVEHLKDKMKLQAPVILDFRARSETIFQNFS